MEELVGPLMTDEERLASIKQFFTEDEWENILPYERMVYGRLWENYCVMQRLGLTESKPDFVINWERRKNESCKSKTSGNNKSSASNSKPTPINKGCGKRTSFIPLSKVIDPDWTPYLETKSRYPRASKAVIDTSLPSPSTSNLPQAKGTTSKSKKNCPVWATSRKAQREKLLLSDDQQTMLKHFKSFGIIETGPRGSIRIKIERPRRVTKKKFDKFVRDSGSNNLNIGSLAPERKKICKETENEINQIKGISDTECGLTKIGDLINDIFLCRISDDNNTSEAEMKSMKKYQTNILDGASLPHDKEFEGQNLLVSDIKTNFVSSERITKKESKDEKTRRKCSDNLKVICSNASQDTLENHKQKNEAVEDFNKDLENSNGCKKPESLQIKEPEYSKPEFGSKSQSKESEESAVKSPEPEPEKRYPTRNIKPRGRKNKFIRHLGPDDFKKAEGTYCAFCQRSYFRMCFKHPLTYVKNNDLPRDGSVPDRIHMSAPFPLKVTNSQIPGAGEGVITTEELPPGLVFGPYEGVIVPHVTEENETGYGWEVEVDDESGRTVVDASDPSRSNWLAKVNCPTTEEQDNLAEQFMFGNVFYITKKTIPRGSELCVYYGDSYAKDLCIDKTSTHWNGLLMDNCDPNTVQNEEQCTEKEEISKTVRRNKPKKRSKKCQQQGTKKKTVSDNSSSTSDVEKYGIKTKKNKDMPEGNNKLAIVENAPDCKMINLSSQPRTSELKDYKSRQQFSAKDSFTKIKGEQLETDVQQKLPGVVCSYCKQWRCQTHDPSLMQKHYNFCRAYVEQKRQQNMEYILANSVLPTKIEDQLKSSLERVTSTSSSMTSNIAQPQHNAGPSLENLIQPLIITDNLGEKKYFCIQCGYETFKNALLKIHILSHGGEKPFKCPHCNYQALHKGHLNQHIRSMHKGEKPHGCPHCDFRTSLKSNVNRHILSKHTGQKPYECPQCDYRSALKETIKSHIVLRHTGLKPHECPQCDYRTAHKGYLKIHIIRMHRE